MTKLHEEILQAIRKNPESTLLNKNQWGVSPAEKGIVEAVSEVALKWIREACVKSIEDAYNGQLTDYELKEVKEQLEVWLSENNLIEKQ